MNNELEFMCKETALAYLGTIHEFLGGTEENDETPQNGRCPGRDSNIVLL